MNKWQLIVIGIVGVALALTCFGCGNNPESAKQNLIDVAEKMGGADPMLAQSVISTVEGGGKMPWSLFDNSIQQATPETQAAYHKYRSAVIKSKK